MVADLCFELAMRVVPIAGMLTMRVVQSVDASPRPTMAVVVGQATRSEAHPNLSEWPPRFDLVQLGAVDGGLHSCGCVPMCSILSVGCSPNVPEGVAKVVERPSMVLMSAWLSLVTHAPLLGMALENRFQSLGLIERRLHRRLRVAKSGVACRYWESSLMLCWGELVREHCLWSLGCRRRSLTLLRSELNSTALKSCWPLHCTRRSLVHECSQ